MWANGGITVVVGHAVKVGKVRLIREMDAHCSAPSTRGWETSSPCLPPSQVKENFSPPQSNDASTHLDMIIAHLCCLPGPILRSPVP